MAHLVLWESVLPAKPIVTSVPMDPPAQPAHLDSSTSTQLVWHPALLAISATTGLARPARPIALPVMLLGA